MSQHIKNIIDSYYYFFDKKLKNTTVIVGLIWMLILLVGISFWADSEHLEILNRSMKTNILESKETPILKSIKNLNSWEGNIIEIAWVQYSVVLSEIE